jgi:hypothetical protein
VKRRDVDIDTVPDRGAVGTREALERSSGLGFAATTIHPRFERAAPIEMACRRAGQRHHRAAQPG